MLLQLNLLLRIFMVLAEMILMSLSKTLNLIMMSMRTNGCFFQTWELFLLAFQPTSIPVNCLRNSEIFGKFLLFSNFSNVNKNCLLCHYRLFAPDTTANEEIENLDNLSSLDISMLLSEEDSLEVIFLDIEGNLSKEQQRCLDLFQELPDFWQDFLQR